MSGRRPRKNLDSELTMMARAAIAKATPASKSELGMFFRVIVSTLLLPWRQTEAVLVNDAHVDISYVMEPFEVLDQKHDRWFRRVDGRPASDEALNLSLTDSKHQQEGLFGNRSLSVRFAASRYAGFGYILREEKPHNCHGAKFLSLWFKGGLSVASSREIKLRLSLIDDSRCAASQQASGICRDVGPAGQRLDQFAAVRKMKLNFSSGDGSFERGSWHELRVPIEDFMPRFPADIEADGSKRLNLKSIRGWRFDVAFPQRQGSSTNTNSSVTNTGLLLLDQLACLGGGEMLGSSFYLNKNRTWSDAVRTGEWIAEYYQSDLSKNSSQVKLEAGVLLVNYTVEMVESWGGFVGLTHLAPGPAYYNLSGAKHLFLQYRTAQAASAPDRSHLRITFADSSHCTVNCSLEYWGHERWYSFHYVLDNDFAKDGDYVLIPLHGSTEPDTPFWLTGWSGEMGNSQLDLAYIKGYTLEFNIDSQGEMGSTAQGILAISNMQAVGDGAILNKENEVSYVIEPFETMTEEDKRQEPRWFRHSSSPGATVNLSQTNDRLFGESSLRVDFTLQHPPASSNTTKSPTAAVSFGWLQWYSKNPHNCHGAKFISVWYKVLELRQEQSWATSAVLTLTLVSEHSKYNGTSPPNEQQVFVLPLVRPPKEDDWHELRVPFHRLEQEIKDPFRFAGWRFEIAAMVGESATINTNHISLSGVLQLDQLACVGGGELLGSSFYLEKGMVWENAISTGEWFEEYYQSNISKTESRITLNQGHLFVRYTVQMVETWGGFLGFTHLAPASAYYNLSQATDLLLGYRIQQPASPPGRVHLRINLADGSNCTVNCSMEYWGHERWYSFSYVLDGNSTDDAGQILMPFRGSTDPDTPFWLTGWSGEMGNSKFDLEHIKGFTLEFNIDSQGEMGSTASGLFEMFNMAAVTAFYDRGTSLEAAATCVPEADLNFDELSPQFTRKEFLGSKCCEVCREDPECLYALSNGRDCFISAAVASESFGMLNTGKLQSSNTAFWMDDATKRGDFCDLCDCRKEERTIDCRFRDLAIVPKTFSPTPAVAATTGDVSIEQPVWTPIVLDLRFNPRLTLVGKGSIASISETLQEVRLPQNLRYLSLQSMEELPSLKKVVFEKQDYEGNNNALMNVIETGPSQSLEGFHDVCCGRGPHIPLDQPTEGLIFCNLTVKSPGVDATYFPFIEFPGATAFKHIRPGSDFMAEATESAEKCAEYCAISKECKYFSYDHRLPNAEHTCTLLEDNGNGPFRVCCDEDHFADDAGTIPGWISGLPPRTRHKLDNAVVLREPRNLVLDPQNQYQAHFVLKLGSTPIRGAVWVEPVLVASSTNLSVSLSLSPRRVVLYDSNTTAVVNVTVTNVDAAAASSSTFIVHNKIQSCDAAFMLSTEAVAAKETSVYVKVSVPPEEGQENSKSKLAMVIAIPVAFIFVLALIIFAVMEWKQKQNDAVWKVDLGELKFAEPPEVIGRGTFGLVLLAEYRGTQVAVKRVIPQRMRGKHSTKSSTVEDGASESSEFMISPSSSYDHSKATKAPASMSHGYTSVKRPGATNRATSQSWIKMKKEFISEMRYLSKLRHPCITTVMGAVIDHKQEPMLVMEYMDFGSLYDILHNETMVIEGELLLPILQDISQGLRFLHAAVPLVIHGDLKAQNVLVDRKFRAKVADFGLSQKKNIGGTGTPFWMAPELLRGESRNSTASDVYSFGITLYEVYSRQDPYDGEDPEEVLSLVADKNVNKRPPVPLDCPPQVQSLMNDCLIADPEQRPSFEELDQRMKRIEAKNIEPSQQKINQNSSSISLFDIFPRHIAEALRDGRKVEPEHKDMVTIFFSDIVGFTDISAKLSPRKVADMLDRLYKALDSLSDKHEIFKVETVGDAYMCVTNLVKDQADDHVKRIAEFAVDAIEAANSTSIDNEDPESEHVMIRCGFHSGPVVADVVGSRNLRYCLFGDTVNTASRMESNSEANRILCSAESAELLRKQHQTMLLKPRHLINVKGKGLMKTFWVSTVVSKDEDLSVGESGRFSLLNIYAPKQDSTLPILPPEEKSHPVSLTKPASTCVFLPEQESNLESLEAPSRSVINASLTSVMDGTHHQNGVIKRPTHDFAKDDQCLAVVVNGHLKETSDKDKSPQGDESSNPYLKYSYEKRHMIYETHSPVSMGVETPIFPSEVKASDC